MVWVWGQDFRERMFDDGTLPSYEAFAEDWRQQQERGRRSWAVFRGAELGGCLISTRLSPELADIHLLFKKTFWGRATTLPALRMVCEELFATGVQRIETTTVADGRASLALAKAIGATRERVLPAQTSRNGMPVDMIVLGLDRNTFLANTEAAK